MEEYVVLKVYRPLKDQLKKYKREMGFRTMQALLRYLLLYLQEKKVLAVASYRNVFITTESRPVIITGPSGSGKTTATKNILRQLNPKHPIFILDVSDEYEYPKIGLGEFFSLDWIKNPQVRFVPHSQLEICRAQASTIFSHLNFIKNSGQLKNAVIVIEEAHRFVNDAHLRALIIEARKFIRKLIIVTTDWHAWEGIAPVFRPPPWNFSEVKENDK